VSDIFKIVSIRRDEVQSMSDKPARSNMLNVLHHGATRLETLD